MGSYSLPMCFTSCTSFAHQQVAYWSSTHTCTPTRLMPWMKHSTRQSSEVFFYFILEKNFLLSFLQARRIQIKILQADHTTNKRQSLSQWSASILNVPSGERWARKLLLIIKLPWKERVCHWNVVWCNLWSSLNFTQLSGSNVMHIAFRSCNRDSRCIFFFINILALFIKIILFIIPAQIAITFLALLNFYLRQRRQFVWFHFYFNSKTKKNK